MLAPQSPAFAAASQDSDNGVGPFSDCSDDSCFEHGPASGGVGNELFAAIRGSAAQSHDQPQRKRSLEALLREAASALSQGASSALGQGNEQQELLGHQAGPRKAARRSVLLSSQHEIGVRYGIAKGIAIANGRRHWATDWALKEYPDMCRKKKARDQFLKNARRWCTNA